MVNIVVTKFNYLHQVITRWTNRAISAVVPETFSNLYHKLTNDGLEALSRLAHEAIRKNSSMIDVGHLGILAKMFNLIIDMASSG